MNATIGFKLQVTATPGFHSLVDWGYQMICLISGTPENPEADTVMERNLAEAFNSAVESLIHAIWTENEHAQQNVPHRMIPIARPWTIRRWS
jgi:hypothetical protein